MIVFNYSKAKHYKQPFKLNELFDNPDLHPYNKDAFKSYTNNSKLVETRIRYINESRHDISIINGNGFTINIPADNGIRNRLIVCVTVQWGKDCDINLKALQSHMSDLEPDTIDKILSQVKTRQMEHGAEEVSFYYSVDLTDIRADPYGIWVEVINVQVVATNYADTCTFFTREALYRVLETLHDPENCFYATNLAFSYFTNDPSIVNPVFIPVGNDAIEVKPIQHPGYKTGLYINLDGGATFVADKTNRKSLAIMPEQFKEYGIYDSYREFLESVTGTKTGDRKHLERMLKTFKRYHRTLGDEDDDYLSIKEVRIVGSLTIGDFFELVTEVNKLDSLLEKVFRKK